MRQSVNVALLSVLGSAYAQQVGTNTAETHPKLQTQTCTASGCTNSQNSVVLDANWRWTHSTSGYTNCYTGNTWDATLCPDGATCTQNCALEGADYAKTYGITTTGNSLTLKLVTGSNVGSRVYLMDTADSQYQLFNLKNKEFAFDVDVSQLPCGLNGALYFVTMDADGGVAKYSGNKAGAKYGTGYCDSQCPQDIKFIQGQANVAGWTGTNTNSGTGNWGSCCGEMDIWEANSISTAYTPHPCKTIGGFKCTDAASCGTGDSRYGASAQCDKDGCDFNSYRLGNTSFYGPGGTLDTKSKMTIVTQFITTDGTNTGDLKEIRRVYVQNGKVFQNSAINIPGVPTVNSLTDDTCATAKSVFGDTNSFKTQGGMKKMGDDFQKGMVLVLSIWDDYAAKMRWLDAPYPETADQTKPGVVRGTCSVTSGDPADVEKNSPNSQVTFSNIKTGTIGSTFKSS